MTTPVPVLRPADQSEVSSPVPLKSRPRTPARRTLIAGLVAVGLAAGAVGVYDRVGRPGSGEAAEPVTSGRAVTATGSTATAGGTELLLPAQTMPNQQTTLHPRVDGYVTKWHADRGARVTAGQLLAEVAAPELDQQAGQAEAALERGRAAVVQLKAEGEQAAAEVEAAAAQVQHAEADAKLAERELDRLSSIPAVSQSERDTAVRNRAAATARVAVTKADAAAKGKLIAVRSAAVTAQQANVRALEADLARLKELQGFKRVVAPFAGTITRRHAEVGMRVAATAGGPLFDLQDASVLRVQVDGERLRIAQLAPPGRPVDVRSPTLLKDVTAEPDLVFAAGPGIRRLISGELAATEAIDQGVIHVVFGEATLLERFASTFAISVRHFEGTLQ